MPTIINDDNIYDLVRQYGAIHGWKKKSGNIFPLINEIRESLPTDLKNKTIDKWDVSRVTDMSYLFAFLYLDKADMNRLNKWNVKNVTNMDQMFYDSNFNGKLDKWNVGNVKSMNKMFMLTPFNQNINDWNVSNVTNMDFMFTGSHFNSPVYKWNVKKVMSMDQMFSYSVFNQDVNNWNINENLNVGGMFDMNVRFDYPLNNWEEKLRNIDTSRMFNSSNREENDRKLRELIERGIKEHKRQYVTLRKVSLPSNEIPVDIYRNIMSFLGNDEILKDAPPGPTIRYTRKTTSPKSSPIEKKSVEKPQTERKTEKPTQRRKTIKFYRK